MAISFRKRVQIKTIESKKCPECDKEFNSEDVFCRFCGSKLTSQEIKVYANIGKRGVTSWSYVYPGGKTINSKGKITASIGNGFSFTKRI